MTALPKHRPTQKGPKIKRISHQYIHREPEKDKAAAKPAEEQPKQQPQSPSVQPQPQRTGSFGWAQPNPPQQQQSPWRPFNQPNPVPGWWMAVVLMIVALLAFIFVFNALKNFFPDIGTDDGPIAGGNCPTSCSPGSSITVVPGCDCPPGTRSSFMITNPPSMYGGWQCTC